MQAFNPAMMSLLDFRTNALTWQYYLLQLKNKQMKQCIDSLISSKWKAPKEIAGTRPFQATRSIQLFRTWLADSSPQFFCFNLIRQSHNKNNNINRHLVCVGKSEVQSAVKIRAWCYLDSWLCAPGRLELGSNAQWGFREWASQCVQVRQRESTRNCYNVDFYCLAKMCCLMSAARMFQLPYSEKI